MTSAQLVLLSLKLSVIVLVFALGLKTAPSDWIWLLRRPALLARSLVAMNLVMPLYALAAIQLLHLKFAVAVALVALSLSPVPPLLPGKQVKAGGESAYAVDLLAIASVISVAWIPIAIEIVERITGRPLVVSPWAVALVVIQLVLVPLLAGTLLGWIARGLASRLAPLFSRAAGIVLVIALVVILLKALRPGLALLGEGTLAVLAGFAVVGLVVGHLLGGPEEGGRSVLALACASRHPGVAFTIARLNFPDERAVPAAILIYLVVSGLISLAYVRWRKRSRAPSG